MWSINNHNDDFTLQPILLLLKRYEIIIFFKKNNVELLSLPKQNPDPKRWSLLRNKGDGAAPHTSAEERVAFSSMAERLLRKQPLGLNGFCRLGPWDGVPHGTHRMGPVLDGGSFARGLVCVRLVGETATTREIVCFRFWGG